jgi:hypothetical protein
MTRPFVKPESGIEPLTCALRGLVGPETAEMLDSSEELSQVTATRRKQQTAWT